MGQRKRLWGSCVGLAGLGVAALAVAGLFATGGLCHYDVVGEAGAFGNGWLLFGLAPVGLLMASFPGVRLW